VHGLYAWLRRNPVLVDGVLALFVVLAGLAIAPVIWVRNPAILPIILGLAVPVVTRRESPVLAFAAVIAVGAIQVAVSPWPSGADIAIMVLLYTLAVARPRKDSLLGLAACLIGACVACVRRGGFHHTKPSSSLILVSMLSVPPLVATSIIDPLSA
jgi:hypothetical protein